MSDDKTPDAVAQPSSPSTESVQEIKGEFTRKLSNTEAKIDETRDLLSKQIEQMNQILAASTAPPVAQAPAEEDINTQIFDNPSKVLAEMEARTEQRIMDKMQQQQVNQNKHQAVLASLVRDFPELGNDTNELTKRALALHQELGADEKLQPSSYRAAVYQAATELGVVPTKQRKNSDDFSLGGGSGGDAASKKSSLSENSLAFAELMGFDTKKDDVRKRLEAHAENLGSPGSK